MNIQFITLHVKNLAASEKFYTEVIGLTEMRRFSPQPGMNILFLVGDNGFQLELIEAAEHTAPQPHGLSIGLYVDSLLPVLELLETYNIPVKRGPISVPSGQQLLFVVDPDGVEVEFVAAV